MQKYNVNDKKNIHAVEILKVLAHPIRYSIAKVLLENDIMNVGAIQECLSLPQSTVSQHISKMRQLGLVEDSREGTKIFYKLIDPIAIKIVKEIAD